MNIRIKTPKEEKQVTVEEAATVQDLRVKACEIFEVPESRICIIFAGKILQDGDTLTNHKIKDGVTVHVVIRNPPQAASSETTRTETPVGNTTTPAQPSSAPLLGGLFNTGGNGFADIQRNMQSQIMQNPEMLNQLLDSPLTQSLMNNPEIFRTMLESNPQMREVIERNPEIGRMMNDPEIMRQSLEVIRNPPMMQEMVRNYDRFVSNLESMPGGMNHLQRFYRDVQEPMMDAATGQHNNPFADLAGPQPDVPRDGPMPNPWSTNTAREGNAESTSNNAPSTEQGQTTNDPIRQMMNNPNLLASTLRVPYVQSMMDAVMQNPQVMEEMMQNNPLLRNMDSATRERMVRMFPQIANQMNQPAFRQILTNPRALQAFIQLQESFEVLEREVPGAIWQLSSLNTRPGGETNATNTGSSTTQPAANQPELTALLASMFNSMSTGNTTAGTGNTNTGTVDPPEQRYATQLEVLSSMGFINRDANLRALSATLGDVNAAIDRLLHSGGGN